MINATNTLKTAFMVCLLAAPLVGCASSRKAASATTDTTTAATATKQSATQTTKASSKQSAEFVPTVNANRTGAKALSSDMKLKLSDGSKSISCGGSLRMKRDDVIQINLTYKVLISINVGTMELTRDSILVLDRINNQYIRATYDEIPYLKKAGINFYSFQSLFWGELFVPNDKGAKPSETDFQQSKASNGTLLTYQDKNLVFKFLTDAISGLINKTTVTTPAKANMSLQMDYAEWNDFGNGMFPNQMTLTIADGKQNYKAAFTLSDIEENSKWETRTSFNAKKYTRVSLNSILNQLMRIAK